MAPLSSIQVDEARLILIASGLAWPRLETSSRTRLIIASVFLSPVDSPARMGPCALFGHRFTVTKILPFSGSREGLCSKVETAPKNSNYWRNYKGCPAQPSKPLADLDDSRRESMGHLLRQVMSCIDHAVVMRG
jgi:hypothetical protein